MALLPFPKTGKGNTRALRPFPKAETLKKARPFQETGELTRLSDSSEMQVRKRRGTYVPHGEEPFSSPRPFGNRPGTSPRPGARKNTSALSFPRPDGTPPGSTLPACAAARHLPERTRGTTTDDVRRVRTRLNAGRPNAAVCLYRHARRPIFFPAARKARADTAPR